MLCTNLPANIEGECGKRMAGSKPTFYSRTGKRLFDGFVSAVGLVALSPVLATVAIAVKLTSRGPVIFSQLRTGRLGRPFRILKFRSMRQPRKGDDSLITAAGDPRVTRFGRWLRATKIDELPQLINVLLGHMSLVGPRPEVPAYTNLYSTRQQTVLLVRPGITSPEICFNEEELLAIHGDKERFYLETVLPAKLESDVSYCEQITFGRDAKIIVHTVARVLAKSLSITAFSNDASLPSNQNAVPALPQDSASSESDP
jgi:lipopolysaccharide/colanic/teichoic acid biosynthesis glycosyltransferase